MKRLDKQYLRNSIMNKIYTLISEDGRVFYDEGESVAEVLEKSNIPIKAVFDDKHKVVYRKED